MRSEIAQLPTDAVHLIAAGEVIDSLAAVVRELVENALDAGATRLTIALWPEQGRVRVADNGQGMPRADLEQAAIAHSTSKIRHASDLWHITTLGFRGEALHSLAQLSTLQIASRPQPTSPASTPDLQTEGLQTKPTFAPHAPTEHRADTGWAFTYDRQGEPLHSEPVAIAPGTIVTVEDLFAPFPSRRQSLPPLAQQLRAVQTTLHQFALCYPQVTWTVHHNERPWLTIFPGESPQHILPQLLRGVQFTDLQATAWPLGDPSESAAPQPEVYVLLGLPDRCHRHRPDWLRIAVNGRCVQFPELEQTILTAFRRTLPRDRYPVCFVHLHVPPDQIDWNRHPAKAELYLKQLPDWQAKVAQAIAHLLQHHAATLPDSLHTQRLTTLLATAEAQGNYAQGDRAIATRPAALDNPTPHAGPKAIAQVHQMYILAEHATGIWLIEQHIAHERVLYEQLCDRWQIVPLDPPLLLQQLTTAQLEQLARLGIEVEAFGADAWVARSAPAPVATRPDCAEALLELSLGGDLPAAQAAIACRTAIRNGTPLTPTEMQTLLNQWHQTRNPRTCPHGRPICLTLAESSLARFFRRHWMIGKSHGL